MKILQQAKALYGLEGYDCAAVSGHQGGRNRIYVCRKGDENKYVLRLSLLDDRSEEDYLAETEFVHYLARNGAPVADVIPSINGKAVERIGELGKGGYAALFEYARGMLMYDNGYRYREGVPLSEYFYNTGKALGAIHRLSKDYRPVRRRADFFDKYHTEFVERLIPDEYKVLKQAILKRLEAARMLTVWTAEHEGRLRKYYRITEAGVRRIEEFKIEWSEVDAIYRFVTREDHT